MLRWLRGRNEWHTPDARGRQEIKITRIRKNEQNDYVHAVMER